MDDFDSVRSTRAARLLRARHARILAWRLRRWLMARIAVRGAAAPVRIAVQ